MLKFNQEGWKGREVELYLCEILEQASKLNVPLGWQHPEILSKTNKNLFWNFEDLYPIPLCSLKIYI